MDRKDNKNVVKEMEIEFSFTIQICAGIFGEISVSN